MGNDSTDFVEQVEAFEIDPGAKTLRFVDRLARENNWSVNFAARVELEYKRFCILAMRSGHPVTPSEQVDQAWHLHLTYTRSYWNRFCQETLGGPLHHEPTEGGVAEGEKFRDWYSQTLASYQQLFGAPPPEDIWPSPDDRFAHAGAWKWVNVGHSWVIPKRTLWICAALILMPLTAIALPGCAASLSLRPEGWPFVGFIPAIFPFDLGGAGFLMFYGTICCIVLAGMIWIRTSKSQVGPNGVNVADVPKLGVDELAVLAGGGSRLAHVALTRLYADDRIEGVKKGWWWSKFSVKEGSTPPEGSALDRDLYYAIDSGTATNQLIKEIQPHFDQIDRSLVDQGLRNANGWLFGRIAWLSFAFMIGVGLLRLGQGLWVGEEVGFLILMMGAFVVVSLLVGHRSQSSTAKGRAYLDHIKSSVAPKSSAMAGQDAAALALGVAVLGPAAVSDIDGLAPLNALIPNIGKSNAGAGCGAGCGGGCGGGGCGGGGCGGCGG